MPFEFDFRMLPQYGAGGSDVVTWRKTDFVLDSRIVYACPQVSVRTYVQASKLTCWSGLMVGGNSPDAKVRPSRDTWMSNDCLADWYWGIGSSVSLQI